MLHAEVGLVVLVALLSGASFAQHSAPAPERWKLALGENGFVSGDMWGYQITCDEILRHAAELGYEGIELMNAIEPFPDPEDEQAVQRLRERYERLGLKIIGLQCAPRRGRAISPDPRERRAYAQEIIRHLRLVKALGGEYAGVWPGGRRPDLPDEVIVRRLADVFRQVAPVAEELGIKFTIEPEPVQIDYNYDIALRIIEATGSPMFGVIYDPTHAATTSGGDPLGVLERVGKRIFHVHFADSDGTQLVHNGRVHSSKHLAAGEGNLDLRAILRKLKQVGYRGWIQVDMWQNPTPLESSRKTKAFLDKVLDELWPQR